MMQRFIAIILAMVFVITFSNAPVFSRVTVGEEISDSYETGHPYEGSNGVIWQQRFTWPDAGYIAIHFSSFSLAAGDYVEISSPDGRFIRRFEGQGKQVQDVRGHISEFWATHIPGDAAIVKLVSTSPSSGYGFTIDKWAHGFEQGYIDAVLADLEEATVEAICSNDDKKWAKCMTALRCMKNPKRFADY
jgi:hypothetical protein